MNKLALLKELLPGFLPLFIFIIVDAIWGTIPGLIVAIGFGVLEFLYTALKNKLVDRFILFDTVLLVVLGMTSLTLKNDIFFKLKPALIELILCIILGISAFTSNNILLLMSKRYLKNVTFNDYQINKMKKSLKVLFVIILLHIVLIVYSAYFMDKKAWLFISGGLFYFIFGVYFLIEFISNKLFTYKYKDDEWLPLVDLEGKVVGKAPRTLCHQKPSMLHPVVHLHLVDNNKALFLQKRLDNKLVQPGKWDTAVGGHISINETLESGLYREALEELGISDFKPTLLTMYPWQTDIESELVFMYITVYNKSIKVNSQEISEGKFWPLKEIEANLNKDIFTPNLKQEFLILKKFIENNYNNLYR